MQPREEGKDPWASGNAYEAYIGRWSARVAPEFLGLLGVPPGARWLDVGCGTGVLTRAILADADPKSVLGIDPSAPFIDHARAATADTRATFRLGSAAESGLPDQAVDAVVSGLVLMFVPDVPAALAEARRVVTPGGVVAAYLWDYVEGMQFIRAFWDAAVALDPAAQAFDQGAKYPIARPEPLRDAFSEAGLDVVEVSPVEIPTPFEDFEDFWTPFTGGTGTAPVYIAGLKPEQRDAIRARLRSTLPIEPDGRIHLSARAWAARGRTPRT